MSEQVSQLALPENFSERCRMLGSSTLYEASGLPCAVDPLIRTIWTGASIAAPAYPLVCSPGDNLSIHIAMERVPRGSVLVVGTGNFIAGYWGEVLTVAAEAAGVVGLIIDGGVRDIAAMTHRRFPVFARGVSVRGTDGVIIIPAAEAERTIAAGEARAAKEAVMMKQLAQGATTLELMGLTQWRKCS